MNGISIDIKEQDILFTDDLTEVCSYLYAHYYLHIFVLSGTLSLQVGERQYTGKANDGIILIEGKPIRVMKKSDDVRITAMLLSNKYLQAYMPKISFNVKGLTFYYDHPIMSMDDEDMQLCLTDMDDIRRRLVQKQHLYYKEVLRRSIDNFTYDIFDIYTRCNQAQATKGGQEALVTQHFIDLLKVHVRTERMVEFYADKLCVTPKYLSRVCQASTGHPASYWISQYALGLMLERLTESNHSLTDISNEFNFQSLSHFTRFIKKHTGITPSAHRMRKKE